MSCWTHVKGIIVVNTMGRTDAEGRYLIESVLEHLPIVSGSEHDMDWYLNKKHGYNVFKTHDEYDTRAIKRYPEDGSRNHDRGIHVQTNFVITIYSNLRDRFFDETFKEFWKWLYRLSKRIWVESCDVKVSGHLEDSREFKSYRFDTGSNERLRQYLYNLEEHIKDGVIPWSKHLRWEPVPGGFRGPRQLYAKYTMNKENDKKVGDYLDIPIYDNTDYQDE